MGDVGVALFAVDRYVSTVLVVGGQRPYYVPRTEDHSDYCPGRSPPYGCISSISDEWY